jgi:hypothetical protein
VDCMKRDTNYNKDEFLYFHVSHLLYTYMHFSVCATNLTTFSQHALRPDSPIEVMEHV